MSHVAQQLASFSAADGYRLSCRTWQPVAPRARVVFVHGLISHGGWYVRSCQHLAEQGYEVHFLDRRGSGLNLPARGDATSHEVWLRDVADYLADLPASPTVLLGMSWGGKFVVAFARYRPDLVQGIAMICPGLFAYQQANLPKRVLLTMLGACGGRNLKVTVPLQDPALFTATPAHQSFVAQDPLTLRKISVRFALADLQFNQYAARSPELIQTPTLLMLSGQDRICDNRRTKAFFDRIGSPEKQLIEYPDWGHTLEFEEDPSQYLEDLTVWIAERT